MPHPKLASSTTQITHTRITRHSPNFLQPRRISSPKLPKTRHDKIALFLLLRRPDLRQATSADHRPLTIDCCCGPGLHPLRPRLLLHRQPSPKSPSSLPTFPSPELPLLSPLRHLRQQATSAPLQRQLTSRLLLMPTTPLSPTSSPSPAQSPSKSPTSQLWHLPPTTTPGYSSLRQPLATSPTTTSGNSSLRQPLATPPYENPTNRPHLHRHPLPHCLLQIDIPTAFSPGSSTPVLTSSSSSSSVETMVLKLLLKSHSRTGTNVLVDTMTVP